MRKGAMPTVTVKMNAAQRELLKKLSKKFDGNVSETIRAALEKMQDGLTPSGTERGKCIQVV